MPDNRSDKESAEAEVTAAGIARLAGVGRAAVSNWRRRYPHFPQPVGGTESSPAFSLAEVEEWLREQGKLAEVPLRERVWQQLETAPEGTAAALARAGEQLLRHPSGPRTGLLGEWAEEAGPATAYEFLLRRYFDANSRQYTLTPPDAAELMAELAGPADSVLDPACGSGELLAAAKGLRAPGPSPELHGQESDADLARLAALRLTLRGGAAVHIRTGDALRDGAPDTAWPAVDAVLCHPPFNERNWGHDELAYDSRWEYGLPARTESELAWVQHALARLRPGGTAVLLMPPAAASRRTGRRIRAALLRRGALRAVVALPAGAAPPHSLALHLWVLRKPDGEGTPAPRLLLVDAGGRHGGAPQGAPGGRGPLPWPELSRTVLDAWRAFDRDGATPEEAGVSGVVPVIDLLDDDVDLAPARHLPPVTGEAGAAALADVRDNLDRTLRRTRELAASASGSASRPGAGSGGAGHGGAGSGGAGPGTQGQHRPPLPDTTIGELVRAGALEVRTGAGTDSPSESALTRAGDVVVPLLGRGAAAYVVAPDTAGEPIGRHTALLRPDPEALDPHFVAGFLRGTANTRQASSHASSTSRLDVRRLRLPRLPLAEQAPYAEHFRQLAAFEAALRLAGELGEQLVQGMYDGLTDGTVPPGGR